MDIEGMEPLGAPIEPRAASKPRVFLDAAGEKFLLARLTGISDVHLRVMAGDPVAGREVFDFLADSGFSVTSEIVERMVPPPLTRYALRYAGPVATLTVAPEVAG